MSSAMSRGYAVRLWT
ncbi:hypothetical protein HaLaN_31693, partial [Haematococcus lacustris]